MFKKQVKWHIHRPAGWASFLTFNHNRQNEDDSKRQCRPQRSQNQMKRQRCRGSLVAR